MHLPGVYAILYRRSDVSELCFHRDTESCHQLYRFLSMYHLSRKHLFLIGLLVYNTTQMISRRSPISGLLCCMDEDNENHFTKHRSDHQETIIPMISDHQSSRWSQSPRLRATGWHCHRGPFVLCNRMQHYIRLLCSMLIYMCIEVVEMRGKS